MTAFEDLDTEELLRRAGHNDQSAAQKLYRRFRDRLRHMVRVRKDPRMAARADASDVVQEALAEASRRLPEYLHRRPLPYYLWLRQIAWERLVDLQRRHMGARKRSVLREEWQVIDLPDRSANALAERLMASGSSPSERIVREELRRRVRTALRALPPDDRELLVMRYLEQLSNVEIAALMDISERTVKWRHQRALERMHELLEGELSGGPP